MPPRKPAPDQPQRDQAIAERERNVLIDAGAGTGKTTILVDRLVSMIAPPEGPGLDIGRMAAITFTRKAAGELRLRIRERLLQELAGAEPGSLRHDRLRDALAGLDTAYVGTIHAFADRLLRLRPVDAALSPSYEVAEDDEDGLVREAFEVLMHAVQNGTLEDELADTPAAGRGAEATAVVLAALDAGLRAESDEQEFWTYWGLDGLIATFVRHRDLPPPDETPVPWDRAAFAAAVDEFVRVTRPVTGTSRGARWLRRTAEVLRGLRDSRDPVAAFRILRRQLEAAPPHKRTEIYEDDKVAWDAWKQISDDDGGRSLLRRVRDPLDRWMATRLVRLFPVALALYEKVKARRRALDQLDLLLKLRDLLARDRAVRRDYQRLFDHVFVDEFQDTDPLQAEIVLFLCEREPVAERWQDVVLRPGSLTLVGDPKQSIYRFRRADIAMYDRVREIVRRGPCLEVTLSANFRSAPPLIAWLNDRFERVLGRSPDGRPFDHATGTVYHQPLLPGRATAAAGARAVHVLSFDFADGGKHNADDYRALEGRALARYLRALVAGGAVRVQDPVDGRERPPVYGDIAILAVSTYQLRLVFPALDAQGIPYASRGGRLFLEDPLHRQLLLGLRALADPDDGVAMAALLRPPFFALDTADLLRERVAARAEADSGAADDGVQRVRVALEIVRDLRRRRHVRPPGATARDLLDRTALARTIALGPNGAQRLARLREICLLLEERAAAEGLDYDAATARLRDWVDDPVQVDPPYPVGTDAVQVLTVHQAKGLEFPIVVLWDGKGQWDTRVDAGAFKMERDGRGWRVRLHGLEWEEPAGLELLETERQYLLAERRRVVYVAATRARDLLIVPSTSGVKPGKHVCADLLAEPREDLIVRVDPYVEGRPPAWAALPAPAVRPAPRDGTAVDAEVGARWAAAAAEAARPRLRPASVSGEAKLAAAIGAGAAGEPGAEKPRAGRFGSLFGTVVHRAIGALLAAPDRDVEACLRDLAQQAGLTEHLDEAAADVRRALAALAAEGLAGPTGPHLRVEYPVAAPWEGGLLLGGYVDVVGVAGDRVVVIDLKTDAPPAGPVERAYPGYAAQVAAYGALLRKAGVVGTRTLRCGLLFTADGVVRWVDAAAEALSPSTT